MLLTLDLRNVGERDAGAEAFDHSSCDDEQRLGQMIKIIPFPAVALSRLHQLGFARLRFANEINVNVMSLAVIAIKKIIADRQQSQIRDLQPGLFEDFAARGLFKALTEFEVAARSRVIPLTMRAAAASQ